MLISISKLAQVKIKEYAAANNEEPVVRIYVERANCHEARFGIAFDNFKPGDEMTQMDDIKILTDSEYIPLYSNGIDIDYAVKPKEGFIITSAFPVKKSSKGCSSGECSGGCRGCGSHKH